MQKKTQDICQRIRNHYIQLLLLRLRGFALKVGGWNAKILPRIAHEDALLTGERRGRKSYPASHDCSEGTMGHSLNSHQWVVCVSRLGHCAIPAKIRNRQEQPIT